MKSEHSEWHNAQDAKDAKDESPRRRRHEKKRQIRRMTVCAMLIALGCVILILGSLLDVLDLCTAALVALIGAVVRVEYGRGYPWAVYAATAILALVLSPQKGAAVVYAAVGYYPILKSYMERLPRLCCIGLKTLLFVGLEFGLITLTDLITAADEFMPPLYYAAVYVLGFITLWLYDRMIGRLMVRYWCCWRQKIAKLF